MKAFFITRIRWRLDKSKRLNKLTNWLTSVIIWLLICNVSHTTICQYTILNAQSATIRMKWCVNPARIAPWNALRAAKKHFQKCFLRLSLNWMGLVGMRRILRTKLSQRLKVTQKLIQLLLLQILKQKPKRSHQQLQVRMRLKLRWKNISLQVYLYSCQWG